MNNILITGGDGQLGLEIKQIHKEYKYKFYFQNKTELDVSNSIDMENFIKLNQINVIINCAAYTNVNKAEEEKDIAFKVNHLAVEKIALLSKKYNIKLIHVSTDYVFNGKNYLPYTEEDTEAPINVYGSSKLAGDKSIININPMNSIIIRTSWIFSSFGHNFVKSILKLSHEKDKLEIIYDQVGTPTYAGDLARVILDIIPKIDNQSVEVYNYSNEGVVSWYDFAKSIVGLVGENCKIIPIESSEYKTSAKRPYYNVLNKKKIKQKFNLDIPYYRDSLIKCLKMGRKI